MNNFKVSSSNGYLIVNSDSGIVIECNSSSGKFDYLPTIERINVSRFKLANKLQKLPDDIDILRLAFWTKEGCYELPADCYEVVSTEDDYFNKLINEEA